MNPYSPSRTTTRGAPTNYSSGAIYILITAVATCPNPVLHLYKP